MVKFFMTDENVRIRSIDEFEVGCWVELINPTDEEVDQVKELTGMQEDWLKAALDEEESARMDAEDGVTMYIVDSPMLVDTEDGSMYTTIPVALLYNEKCIVSVSLYSNPVLQGFMLNRKRISTKKPTEFILNFMLETVKRFS